MCRNRPLNLVWWLPAQALFPGSLAGQLYVHTAWIGLTGVLVFLLARRLLPGAAGLAFLAGAFTVAWAPGDRARLSAVQMLLYSGCTFATLLAIWLANEGWVRRRPALALLAALSAAVAVLSFEAALAPLTLVPLLFLWLGGARERRRLAAWTAAWLLFVAACGVRAVLPLWTAPERVHYQAQVAPDFRPLPLAVRTLKQLRRHVRPALELPPPSRSWAAPAALGVLLVGLLAARRGAQEPQDRPEAGRKALLAGSGFGLLWACTSYLPFVLNPLTHGAERQQFLSGPGVALLLASIIGGLVYWLPARLRPAATLLLGGWIVAGGVLRTAGLQHDWDADTAFADQHRALTGLAAIAPDLQPGTLVVLVESGAWPLDLTFRHAVKYLYEGRAVGHAVRAGELLYETRFEPDGVRCLPDPVIQGPWHEPPALFPYDALVVLREDAQQRVSLLETWPDELGPLPPGARYAPRERLRLGPLPRRLQALRG